MSFILQHSQPNIRRVESRSRPTRWESQIRYDSRPQQQPSQQQRPAPLTGLLGKYIIVVLPAAYSHFVVRYVD